MPDQMHLIDCPGLSASKKQWQSYVDELKALPKQDEETRSLINGALLTMKHLPND
jgi:hypothetical protein